MKTLGLIVNPIAGMGGSVGLKGTDGVLEEALRRGAVPRATEKTRRALEVLRPLQDELRVLTAGGTLGEDVLKELGFQHQVVYRPAGEQTTATDMQAGAKALREAGAEIVAFAGGDGSARDLCAALAETLPAVGIPAGVKIHSPVYAQSPEKAGELLSLYLRGQTTLTREAEVVDIDEDDYRQGIINTRLYGYMTVPFERRFMQSSKSPSPASEKSQQIDIAHSIISEMQADTFYLVGPGSTTRTLMECLELPNTLLGVDLLRDKQIVTQDLAEAEILERLGDAPAKLIITPTGGQGYLLGRGNQQISPRVIRRLGKGNIIVAATADKLANLQGRPLLVDTGEPAADEILRGYMRVVSGYHETVMYKVE